MNNEFKQGHIVLWKIVSSYDFVQKVNVHTYSVISLDIGFNYSILNYDKYKADYNCVLVTNIFEGINE